METISALLVLCAENPTVTHELLSQGDSNSAFSAFFDVTLNKMLKKTVELVVVWDVITPMWRHCNDGPAFQVKHSVHNLVKLKKTGD